MMIGKKKTLLISLIVLVLALFAGACGSDDNGGSNQDSADLAFGVDKDKKGSDFTESDITEFCDAIGSYTRANFDFDAICNGNGALDAALQTITATEPLDDEALQDLCAESRDQCLDSANTEEPEEVGNCLGELQDCAATAAQLEACHKARTKMVDEIYTDLPLCADFTEEVAQDVLDALLELDEDYLPEECEIVDELCPVFLEDQLSDEQED